MATPTRANPSTDAYKRARKVVLGWLSSLHPESASMAISEDDGGQLIESLSWEIDMAVIDADTKARRDEWIAWATWCELRADAVSSDYRPIYRDLAERMRRGLVDHPLPASDDRAAELKIRDNSIAALARRLQRVRGAVDRARGDMDKINGYLLRAWEE